MSWILPDHTHAPVYTSPHILQHIEISVLFRGRIEDPVGWLTDDAQVILARQKLLQELCRHPALHDGLRALHKSLITASELLTLTDGQPTKVLQSLQLLSELQGQADSLIAQIKGADDLQSEGFTRLADALEQYCRTAFAKGSMEQWKRVTRGLQMPVSLTYRVRFNERLQIAKAALVRVDDTQYRLKGRFHTMRQWMDPSAQEYKAQSMLEKEASVDDEQPGAIELYTLSGNSPLLLSNERSDIRRNIFQVLGDSFDQLMQAQVKEVVVRLRAFLRGFCGTFAGLAEELGFLLGCMDILQDLRDGLYPVCFPEIEPNGSTRMEAVFHPMLEFEPSVTCNDYDPDAWGELLLVSGINTGGKTTYLQSVASVYLLGQLGMPVPAKFAKIYPVPSIAVVLSSEEADGAGIGRLGQELSFVQEALQNTEKGGLILFNEPITGASYSVCTQLTLELLGAAKAIGCRGMWVLHLYNIVERYEEMNRRIGGSVLGSIYVDTKDGKPDHSIRVGIPKRNDYATRLFQR